jgi:nicotinate-nucleotide adenylyltransferase
VRLGIFGGTFDPPHIGHLIVAQDAMTTLGLDGVVFVPAAQPPHKLDEAISPPAIRLAMVKAAIAGAARFEVDDIELRRSGPSWTVQTLREFTKRLPDADLYLLMGSDQFAEFESWREPEEIRRLARLVVLTREGAATDDADVRKVRVTRVDVSSTDVRNRVAAGQPIRFLVPDAVEALIRLHRLYVAGSAAHESGRTGMAPAG